MMSWVLVGIEICTLSALVLISDTGVNPAADLLSLLGIFFALWAMWVLWKHSGFSVFPEVLSGAQLAERGPYALVRHPMYFAFFLFGLGRALSSWTAFSFALIVILLVEILAKIHMEERHLIGELAGYKNYAKKTKRLIPGIY